MSDAHHLPPDAVFEGGPRRGERESSRGRAKPGVGVQPPRADVKPASGSLFNVRPAYRTRPPGVCGYADARLAFGWTQAYLAARVGVTTGSIKRLERGLPVSRPLVLAVRFALLMPWLELGAVDEAVPPRGCPDASASGRPRGARPRFIKGTLENQCAD